MSAGRCYRPEGKEQRGRGWREGESQGREEGSGGVVFMSATCLAGPHSARSFVMLIQAPLCPGEGRGSSCTCRQEGDGEERRLGEGGCGGRVIRQPQVGLREEGEERKKERKTDIYSLVKCKMTKRQICWIIQ